MLQNITNVETSHIDFNALNAFVNSSREIRAPYLINAPPSGEPLFHYTNLDGLHGILSNHDLWLSHAKYLNDEAETTLGYEMAREIIEQKRSTAKISGKIDYLEILKQRLSEENSTAVYICCFCQEDNLLSQWRGYGANGTGVSIKFNPIEFDYATGPDSPAGTLMRLWRVSYKEQEQRKILNKAIDYAFSHFQTLEDRVRHAREYIEFFIPTFKSSDFREEKEYRLIFTPSPEYDVHCKFRIARGMLIPYYSLKQVTSQLRGFDYQIPITGICVGPNPNKLLNVESIKMLLAHENYQHIEVGFSGTKYRA
ncbi:MAG: DUF2971 domain-containing protein [Anaerolineaceae bacterium]|nr:DUF2971 domain-containing protein [Anaerolineaceae bacterium]